MSAAAATCGTCDERIVRPTTQAAADALWVHHFAVHVEHPDATVHQLQQVTFREQALTAIRALACTGKPFTIGDCHELVEAKPVNPRTEWPAALREAVALGWVVWTGEYADSKVPTTKKSAVKVWRGAAAARGAA